MGLSPRQKAQRQQKRAQKKRAVKRIAPQRNNQEKKLIQLHKSYVQEYPLEYEQKKELAPLKLADGIGVYLQHWTDYDLYLSRFLTQDGFTAFCQENISMLSIWGRLGYEKRGKGILVAPGLTVNNGELRYHILFCYVTKDDLDNLDYLYPEVKNVINSWIDSYDPIKDVRILIQRKGGYGEVKTKIIDEDWGDYALNFINDPDLYTPLNFKQGSVEDTRENFDTLVTGTKEQDYPLFFQLTPPDFHANVSEYVCVTPTTKIPDKIVRIQSRN